MTSAAQMPLTFEHRPSMSGEDFLVAACNEEAVAWIDRWPDWPGPGLALYGPEGCGKTHLANVFAEKTGAALVTGADLTALDPHEVLKGGSLLVVDGADAVPNGQSLFHLINTIREENGGLLLTAREAPARWPVSLPDLASRLNAFPAIEIGPPDDFLMEAVLMKLFSDRQLQVDLDVIKYLLVRMERSFAAARAVVEVLDAKSLADRRNITVPLVRATLAEMEGEGWRWT